MCSLRSCALNPVRQVLQVVKPALSRSAVLSFANNYWTKVILFLGEASQRYHLTQERA